jgi:hypothetical protein
MLRTYHINPLARAIGVIGVVAALVAATTYAALQDTATLTNNTIASATADLQISNTTGDPPVCGTPSNTATGFNFVGIVPGGADSQTETFCLHNAGTADLSIAVNVPTAPTWTVLPGGSVDNAQVDVTISCDATTDFAVTDTLQNIIAGNVALTAGSLLDGETAICSVFVSMDAGAFTGSSASSTDFDFVFTGTGV